MSALPSSCVVVALYILAFAVVFDPLVIHAAPRIVGSARTSAASRRDGQTIARDFSPWLRKKRCTSPEGTTEKRSMGAPIHRFTP